MKISLKAYPNGEVNASIARKLPLEAPFVSRHDEETVRVMKETVKAAGIEGAIALISRGIIFGVSPRTLCLSTVAILRKPKGSSGLTRHGRRQIECGTTLLEQRYRRDCLSLTTLTFPPSAVEIPNSKAQANAKHRFTTWLVRRLRRAGLPDFYVGVVEAHPGRSEHLRKFVPHYHLVHVGRKPGKAWAITPEEIKKAWYNCLVLEGLCPPDGDYRACVNMQRIKKSVTKYLGKYLAKTRVSTAQETPEDLANTHPGTWHIISRSLIKLIKQSTKHRSGIEAETILDFLAIEDNPWVLYRGNVEITAEDGSKYWVGSYAKVTQECLMCI